MPPWPGITHPESLTPLRRFMSDSSRSPASAPNHSRTPSPVASAGEMPKLKTALAAIAMAIAAARPPAAPSHVLLGDIVGRVAVCRRPDPRHRHPRRQRRLSLLGKVPIRHLPLGPSRGRRSQVAHRRPGQMWPLLERISRRLPDALWQT